MAKTWTDFLPLITPHVPDCPDAVIKTYLPISTADFFARTYLWRDDIDAIYLAPNQIEYDLDAEAEVEDVLAVVHNGLPLQRTDLRLVPNERRGETGDPVAYWVQADRTIRVFPTPETRAKMTVTAVLKPSRTGTGVEDWIYETWADALVSGAVARLTSIPGKQWTDTGLASLHKSLFEQAIVNARVRDFRGVRLMVKQRPAA